MRKIHRWILLILALVLVLCGCNSTADVTAYTMEDDSGKVWTIDPNKKTITDGEWVFKFKIRGDQQDYTIWIDYPNSDVYTEDKVGDQVFGNMKEWPTLRWWFSFDKYGGFSFGWDVDEDYPQGETLTALLYPLIPEEEVSKNLLLPILLIALGCADILWPKVFWIPRYGRDFRNVELSKRTQTLQNLAGLAIIALGIILWIV